MNNKLIAYLSEENMFLANLMKKLEKNTERALSGSLQIMLSKKKYPQYYWADAKWKDEYPKGKYLKKNEMNIAGRLAQKEYNQKLFEICMARKKAIDVFLSKIGQNDLKSFHENLPSQRKNLISTVILTDEEFRQKWKRETKGGQNDMPFVSEYYTNRDERVRSKSEMILAGIFDNLRIDYVYEPCLILNGSFFYPDFALLDLQNRKTVFYEHFGKMDDPVYVAHVLEKLNVYQKNDIWPGINFLFSMEMSELPLDVKMVEKMLKDRFFGHLV